MERRISAIFAADMVGYSRLMEADEVGTIERQKVYRRELINPAFEKYHGRIVKEMGDGILVEFSSAVEAVQCAVEIQRALPEREKAAPEDRRISYRIGINLGDIVVEDEDIYGDGVNVAARLEQLAEAGGIYISGTVYDQMRSTVEVGYKSLGEVQVKNIERPIRAYKVLSDPEHAGATIAKPPPLIARWRMLSAATVLILAVSVGAAWWWAKQPDLEPADSEKYALDIPDKPSIAVLPFNNLSDDKSQQYFVDGMVEDLITDLSKVPGLFVIARNSSFAYRDKTVDVQQVARELGVKHILEGSVRRAGNRVRINAQLIDGQTNSHVWAERYDGTLEDVFDLQDKITAEIIKKLSVILSPSQQNAIAAHGTRNAEAYDNFLRGMRYLSDRNALDNEGNARAVAEFEKSLKLDPKYANAMAGVAWAKWLYHSSINFSAPGFKEAAFEYAEKSLELADNALAHRVLSRKYYSPTLHIITTREPHRAVTELEAALSIEPNNPDLLADLADVLPFIGQAQRALVTIKRAIRLNPDHPKWYLRALGIAQLLLGDTRGSVTSLREWLDGEKIMVEYTLWFASALALSGEQDEARKLLAYIRVAGPGSLPRTEYAINRKWPLSGSAGQTFFKGLRQAGFPEIMRGSPVPAPGK